MKEIAKRKFVQKMRSTTYEKFWLAMNIFHTRAYALGQKHLIEAMQCTPGISKKKVEEVIQKSAEIRESWDGITTVDVDATEAIDAGLILPGDPDK